MIPELLLDLDGVLVDFVKGAFKAHGKNHNDIKIWETNYWFMLKPLGVTEEEFWVPLNNIDFWANLDWTPDGQAILALVEQYFGKQNICLLTNPSDLDNAVIGKRQWIRKHMPGYVDQVLMGTGKHFCTRKGRLLIDDSSRNIKDHWVKGGDAYMLPRPWNDANNLNAISGLTYFLEEYFK